MAVWRLQANTGGANIADYCLSNHVAAMGWSLDNIPESERDAIQSFDDYDKLAEHTYKNYSSVKRLYYEVKESDIIWMRSSSKGKYYFGRVKADSKWKFNKDAIGIDAANQLTNIDWYPATDMADEESVPGAVATSFIMGSALQRIKKTGVEAYSQLLFNKVHDKARDPYMYPNPDLYLTESHFYSLLQPEDVEDLLALWLYDTKGYVCIPSTNKIATPTVFKQKCELGLLPAYTSRLNMENPKYSTITIDPNKTELIFVFINRDPDSSVAARELHKCYLKYGKEKLSNVYMATSSDVGYMLFRYGDNGKQDRYITLTDYIKSYGYEVE